MVLSWLHKVARGKRRSLLALEDDLQSLKHPEATTLNRKLGDLLRYLHDIVGIVHCDVKPDNLLLRRALCLSGFHPIKALGFNAGVVAILFPPPKPPPIPD